MAESDNQVVAMEEQTIDVAKNPGQQDSAYGSLKSSSQGPSQKSSYSGSKSLNSGSSQYSSGCGDNAHFSGKLKHMSKRRKSKEKTEKLLLKEIEDNEKEKDKSRGGVGTVISEQDSRLTSEAPSTCSISTGLQKTASTFKDERTDQPTLVYTQALSYIRKIKERSAEQGVPFASPELSQLPRDTHDVAAFLKSFKSARGFTVAVSVHDGSVLQVSPAITDVLGFPKDMLVGQSFIDFVYPKDSINLSSKIIHGINMPFRNDSIKDNYGTSFFCRMRVYHSLLSSGFGVRNKRTVYRPCKMVLKFQEAPCMDETASTCGPPSSLLLAEVIPIKSVYQVPEETPVMGSFSTRHSSSCNFSEYDPEAIPFLGHLPQDLTGNSVFDCYHPEDLPMLKTAYEEMVRNQGKPHRSKPYRFRTFNSSWVTLQTEWLCFVNPWTKRIDSIIGQHSVLKGPSDIAIFMDPGDKAPTPLPEEIMKEAEKAQRDIIELLAKPVARYKDPSKEPAEMRRRTLAHMMSSIVDELDNMQKNENAAETSAAAAITTPNNITIPNAATAIAATTTKNHIHTLRHPVNQLFHALSKPSSVQKEIESVTSTDSPSTYGHLNYSETIHRFFRSHPKTIQSDESGDSKMEVSHLGSLTTDASNHKESQTLSHYQALSQSQSGSGSGDNCDHTRKSESTGNCSGSGDTGRTSRSYRHVQLTEKVLSRHNVEMQKMFMARQRTDTGPDGKGGLASSRTYTDKNKIRSIKKPIRRPVERSGVLKRAGGVLEHEASLHKRPFLAPSAAGSVSSLIKPPSSDVWGQPDKQTHMQSAGSVVGGVGPSVGNLGGPLYPSFVQGFYFPQSAPSVPSIHSVSSISVPRAPGPTLVVPPHQPTFLQPQGVAVPLQYIPGVMYQTVGPPLFNAPPLMLPNMVYQHTAVQPSPLIQNQHHLQVPGVVGGMAAMSDGEKHNRSGAESDHDHLDPNAKGFGLKHSGPHVRRPDSQATSVKAEPGSVRGSTASASGKVISSHSHVAESIRSYIEDSTMLSPGCAPKVSQLGQFSRSTSVRAEAESIGSPGKQDKMAMDDREQPNELSSDKVMSVSNSIFSTSTDDSFQENSELSENSGCQSSSLGVYESWDRRSGRRPVLCDPPWLEDVKVTPELLYKYQLETKELVDVLRRDMDKLQNVRQPTWVDDQLSSLYHELELEGSNPSLHLEEGLTSSSGEDQAGTSTQEVTQRRKRSSHYFSKMSMLHEEEAPFPPTTDTWLTARQQPTMDSSDSAS